MAPPTLEHPTTTTPTPPCLLPPPLSPELLFSSPFSIKLKVTSLYQEDIHRTTTSFNAPISITKKNHKLQWIRSDREQHTSMAERSYSQRYWFPVNFSGRARQLESIAIYNSLEALKTLQHYQSSYCKTLITLDILIGHIRPPVSYPWATQMAYSSLLYHSPWYDKELV